MFFRPIVAAQQLWLLRKTELLLCRRLGNCNHNEFVGDADKNLVDAAVLAVVVVIAARRPTIITNK